jgi:hypothetical protein
MKLQIKAEDPYIQGASDERTSKYTKAQYWPVSTAEKAAVADEVNKLLRPDSPSIALCLRVSFVYLRVSLRHSKKTSTSIISPVRKWSLLQTERCYMT